MRIADSPDALLVAALAAMSRYTQALRDGAASPLLAMRVGRCLDALADCTALAPALRCECEHLASLWAVLHPRTRRALAAQPDRGSTARVLAFPGPSAATATAPTAARTRGL